MDNDFNSYRNSHISLWIKEKDTEKKILIRGTLAHSTGSCIIHVMMTINNAWERFRQNKSFQNFLCGKFYVVQY